MEIFIELGTILLITTGVAIIAKLLRQPLVVGYIASGIIVGPHFLHVIKSTEEIELFSKIGISILLFIVGLSLSPKGIKDTGKVSLITGIGQIIFTSVIGYFIITALGFDRLTALYGAIALTFSSTIIILKLLSDRGDLGTLYGRVSIGFLLVQDIVATLLLIIIPIVGGYLIFGAGSESIGTSLLRLLYIALVSAGVIFVITKYVLPKFSRFLARSQELLFLFSVTWGLIMAGLFYLLGFSIEIGALIAGVMLSTSPYTAEISARIRPLRDFFIVLFFVLLGSHVVLSDIGGILIPAIILSLFVLIGNPLIVFILMNLVGYRRKTSFMAGLTVAQISEFSLILMALGLSLGHIPTASVSLITLVGIITIAGSTYLFLYADNIYKTLRPLLSLLEINKHPHQSVVTPETRYDTIIFGYGRVGHEFVRAAKTIGGTYLVIDYNPDAIDQMKRDGVTYLFGDADDVELLQEIGLAHASRVISTIPERATNELLISYYRHHNTTGTIIAISHSTSDMKDLYKKGATYVVMPHYLGATHASELLIKAEIDQTTLASERARQESQLLAAH